MGVEFILSRSISAKTNAKGCAHKKESKKREFGTWKVGRIVIIVMLAFRNDAPLELIEQMYLIWLH